MHLTAAVDGDSHLVKRREDRKVLVTAGAGARARLAGAKGAGGGVEQRLADEEDEDGEDGEDEAHRARDADALEHALVDRRLERGGVRLLPRRAP